MGKWTPCKRRKFIKRLRRLGFDGPYSGTRHQFMLLGNHRLAIPSNSEYSVPQLSNLPMRFLYSDQEFHQRLRRLKRL